MQIKETTDLYVTCGTICFNNCVNNMTARKLSDEEVRTITRLGLIFNLTLLSPFVPVGLHREVHTKICQNESALNNAVNGTESN